MPRREKASSPASSMREVIERLEEKGELVRVRRRVDPRNFELSSIIRKVEETMGKAVLFEDVKNGLQGTRVISNVYGSVYRIALSLGLEPTEEEVRRYRDSSRGGPGAMSGFTKKSFTMSERDRACVVKLRDAVSEAEENSGSYPVKTVSHSPLKEVVIKSEIDVAGVIPVVWHCVEDAGPFMTAGAWITKDPDTGKYGMGIFRSQVTRELYGPNRIGALFSVHSDTHKRLRKYEERGEPMEAALVIAPEPAVQIATVYSAPSGIDELEMAGALKGSSIEMVKCETIDLMVPANSEIVLEGHVLPGVRVQEGPMAEFTDYCREERAPKPVFEVKTITMRRDAIYHTIMSGMSDEHRTLAGIVGWGWEKRIVETLRREFPTVKAASYSPGGTLFHLVVSMKKEREGDDRRLLYYIMGSELSVFCKYITIVDDDVDVYDFDQVEWARCMRAGRPDSFVVFHDMTTHNLDPMGQMSGPPEHMRLTVTKLGILATHRVGEKYRRPGPPDEKMSSIKLEEYT